MKLVIIDYGMGNVLSVSRAFESFGTIPELTADPTKISEADCVVLPGVGGFPHGMDELRSRSLIKPIQDFASSGRPFLGICLGMQMMLDASEEFEATKGLGLIPGTVKAIPKINSEGAAHKIPHIGWNKLQNPVARETWKNTVLEGVSQESYTYFVHSYTAQPDMAEHRLADTYYNGELISAAIQKGNLYGCQFHPEKSGKVGLKIISNFLNISSANS